MKISYPKFPANWSISLALMLSAAAALIYESGATQVLFFYFTQSSYSVATVLGVFLGGLGIGSFIFYKLSRRFQNPAALFGDLQLLIALYAFFLLTNLGQVIPRISELGVFLVSAAILLVPAVFFGMIFPLVVSMVRSGGENKVGLVYSIDLLGSIIGTFLVGFLVIPVWGVSMAMALGSGLNLISAGLILPGRRKLRALTLGVLFLILALRFGPATGAALGTQSSIKPYQFYANSAYGPVAVRANALTISGSPQCSYNPQPNRFHFQQQVAVDTLNLLSKETPLKILNIGLGCGGTLGKLLESPNITVDVVEINPEVVRATRTFSSVLSNPRAHLILDDGLHYLRTNAGSYDAIIVIVDNPRVVYSTPLYTVEAFRTEAAQLKSNGILAVWSLEFANTQGDEPSLTPALARYRDILYYSLREALPHVYKYPGIFLASQAELSAPTYQPQFPHEVNTVDRNTLTAAFLEEFNKARSDDVEK